MRFTTDSSGHHSSGNTGLMRRLTTAAVTVGLAASGTVVGFASPAAAAVSAQDVIDAFTTGGQLTLDQDVEVAESLALGSGRTLTLDLAGYELSVTGADGQAGPLDPAVFFSQVAILNQGNLIIQNGTLIATGGNGGDGSDGASGEGGADGTAGEDGGLGAPGIVNSGGARLALLDVDVTSIGGDGGRGGTGGAGAGGGDGGAGGDGGGALAAISDSGITVLAGGSENAIAGAVGTGGAGGPGDSDGAAGSDGTPGTGVERLYAAVTVDGNGAAEPAAVTVHAYDIGAATGALSLFPSEWPTRTDYAFAGWFPAATGGSRVEPDVLTAGQTIYAQWESMSECSATTFTARLANAAEGSTVALCGDITIEAGDPQLSVPGGRAVTLDLAGHTLTVTGAWQRPALAVGADATLTIEDSVGDGVLDATAGASQAAIELGPRPQTATLIVNGGTIHARATTEYGSGAGIGGSGGDNGGTVVINDGVVHATGTGHSPGIGGSGGNSMVGNYPQPVTINGGEVHATGATGIGGGLDTGSGDITINGGTVYATGTAGPGLGGGQGSNATTSVTITGGDVHAVAGGGGAAIGSSGSSPGPHITISGGVVEAHSGTTGAAIGSGQYSRSTPTITISGDAHVSATATGAGAAIGGGYSSSPSNLQEGGGGTINIESGTVIATAELDPDYPWDPGAAMGGGRAGSGAVLTIGAGADVTVSSAVESAIGPGTNSTDFGSLTNHGTLTVLSGAHVTIPADTTVANDGVITGAGTLDGEGTVDNGGSITHTVTVGDDVTVTDHNFGVSFDAAGGTGTPAGMTLYSETFGGAGLSLADLATPARTGEVFKGWHLEAAATGAAIGDDTSISAASSDGDPFEVTLYAGWGPEVFTVSFATGDGSSVPDALVEDGDLLSEPAEPSLEGYGFAGWYTYEDGLTRFDFDTPVTQDFTLYALWVLNQYSVAFDSRGGTPLGVAVVGHGDVLDQPADPSRDMYAFTGWFTDLEGTTEFDFDTPITGDLTLYAGWEQTTFSVSFDSRGGTPMGVAVVEQGELVSEPGEPSREGYVFAGWFTDSDATQEYDFTVPVTGDLVLYAGWDINEYTVSFDSGEGSLVPPVVVAYGDALSEPVDPSRVGHAFAGWFADSDRTAAYDFAAPVTGDLVLYAGWDINEYTVSFDSGDGSPVSAQTVEHGTRVDQPDNPVREGFEFAGWFMDTDASQEYDFDAGVTGDVTVYAAWTALVLPQLVSGQVPDGVVGQYYEFALAATGYPAPTIEVEGLPAGLTFDATTGVVSGTPSHVGNFTITVTVLNSAGVAQQQYMVEIAQSSVAPEDGEDEVDSDEPLADDTDELAVDEGALPRTGAPEVTFAVSVAAGLALLGGALVVTGRTRRRG